ncbi:MAG: hypothetical protein AAF737_09925 [Pseudomonadota bacterium]
MSKCPRQTRRRAFGLSRIRRSGTRWLAIFALFAVAMVGATHHSVMAASHEQALPAGIVADLEAYRLPDGTLPSFCLPGEDGSHALSADCESCRLADHAAPLSVAAFHPPAPDAGLFPAIADVNLGSAGPNTRRARAPPVFI